MDVHELIEKVADGAPVKREFIRHLVGRIVEEVEKAVVKGESVHIREFGRFEQVRMGPRIRRNPKTKEKMLFPGTVTVKFRPSPKFRDAVAGKKTPVKP